MQKSDLKTKLDKFKELFCTNNLQDIENNLLAAKINLLKMIEVVEAFDMHYKKSKRDKALLDYNDLEHYTVEILKKWCIKRGYKIAISICVHWWISRY